MKTLTTTVADLALMAGAALADGPICEREISIPGPRTDRCGYPGEAVPPRG